MKVATTVLALVVCLAGCADAYWWGGYGMWGGYGLGMYGMWGKRATTEYSPRETRGKPSL